MGLHGAYCAQTNPSKERKTEQGDRLWMLTLMINIYLYMYTHICKNIGWTLSEGSWILKLLRPLDQFTWMQSSFVSSMWHVEGHLTYLTSLVTSALWFKWGWWQCDSWLQQEVVLYFMLPKTQFKFYPVLWRSRCPVYVSYRIGRPLHRIPHWQGDWYNDWILENKQMCVRDLKAQCDL